MPVILVQSFTTTTTDNSGSQPGFSSMNPRIQVGRVGRPTGQSEKAHSSTNLFSRTTSV
ncbi:MAG: hypothetical protein HOP04_03560 [Methylophilaceae bacterium]|nr:hypothetical protein [Methylophilaceae bacterium]